MSFPTNLTNSKPRQTNRFFVKLVALFSLLFLGVLFSSSFASTDLSWETISNEDFLRKVQKDTVRYFIECSDPRTGLTWDSSSPGSPSSVAATGFSLAALTIAQEHGWISYAQAYRQILRTLRTLYKKAQHKNGFFYHFLDPKTGRRTWASEASSIDTALALAGALFAGQHFKGTPIEALAQKIYRRVDWGWMLNGSDLICMGWKPESGFLPYYWDSYSEHLILQALAIGSPTHPIPPLHWNQWFRFEEDFHGKKIVYSHTGGLFTYQYSQAYIDFRSLDDQGVNYFENSRNATLANKEFCLENAPQYKTYSENSWGLSACLGPFGYKAYGAKPGLAQHDGTVAPYASISSLVFTPQESLAALRSLYQKHAKNLYSEYGFRDSFNLDKDWWSYEYLGIDQGIIILMVENYLSEGVWQEFMRLRCIQKWIALCKLNSASRAHV